MGEAAANNPPPPKVSDDIKRDIAGERLLALAVDPGHKLSPE